MTAQKTAKGQGMPDTPRMLLVASLGAVLGGAFVLAGQSFVAGLEGSEDAVPQRSQSFTEGAFDAQASPSDLNQQIRLANLELSHKRLQEELEALRNGAPLATAAATADEQTSAQDSPRPAATPGIANAQTLAAAGVDPVQAELMVARLDELALARLEADYRIRQESEATAEGAKQARLDRRAIPNDKTVIRQEFGDEAYDQYLYSLNQPNRVEVASVLRESTAENAGVQSGDLLRSLDGEPLYSVRDLTRRIRQGDAGRTYNLVVERNGEVIETWVPGGPLGVRVNGAVAKPAG